MATAPYSFPYPSVATYPPPPPFPDGNYYPSPFPYASPPAPGFFLAPAYGPSIFVPPPSPPPAYPYPPPASGYAPLPGFFPAQPYDPSTVPYATNVERNWPPSAPDSIPTILSPAPAPGVSLSSIATPTSPSTTTSYLPEFGSFLSESSCPMREVTPIPTTVDQNHPPPAQTPIHGGPIPANKIANGGVPAGSSVMELHEHVVPRMVENKVSAFHRVSADSVCQGGDLTRGNGAGGRSINGEELVHKQPGTEILSMASNDSNHGFVTRQATTSWPEPSPALDLEKSKTSAEAQIRAEASISKKMPRAVLDLKRRLDELQARDRTSLDNLQGELAKLTSMASQFALSISKQTNPALPASSPLRVTGTAPVASKVFDTMPTSSSGCSKVFGKQSSAAASSLTTSGSSRFGASGSTYAAPQVFGETPTSSLWQGTHGSVPDCCSGRHIPIQSACVSNFSKQNFSEMAQQYDFHNLSRKTMLLSDGSEHSYFALPKNYPLERAVPEPVFDVYDDDTEGCSSKSVDVFAGTPGQQTHEEDPLENEKLAKSFHKASENAFSEQLLRYIVKALETEQTSAYLLDYTFQQQQQNAEKTSTTVQQLRDQQLNVLVMHKRRKEWDPGAPAFLVTPLTNDSSNYFPSHDNAQQFMLEKPPAKRPDRFGIADSSLQVIPFEVQKSEKSSAHTHFNFLCRNSKQFSAVQAIQDICVLLEAIPSWKRSVFSLVHSSETPIKLLIFIEQPIDLKHFMDQFLLQCHSCCHTQNAFPKVQNCCLPIFLACPYFKPDHQLVCYSRMFSSTRAIISVLCMSTASTLFMILALSFEEIAEEGKDGTAVYQVSKIQLPMRQISHAWDPGIKSILVFYKGLHTQMLHLVHCSTIHACDLAPAHLPPKQISAYCPSNIGFVHEQGVQKNYNANNLLSSQKYLQIVELDIIFITFLPP